MRIQPAVVNRIIKKVIFILKMAEDKFRERGFFNERREATQNLDTVVKSVIFKGIIPLGVSNILVGYSFIMGFI